MDRPTILIADDEQDIRELLADFLDGEGFRCHLAKDAFEAMQHFTLHQPIDLVMSDIRMPGKSGLELLSEIKAIDEDVMVIMISAVNDIESAIAAMSKGAYDYVSKPFKLNEVSLIAKKALEKRHLLLENKQYQKRLEKLVEERTVELRQALDELDKTYNFTLRALITALDTRDTETQGHSVRVVKYSLKLAELMGVSDPSERKVIEYGALLHDIGKIGIPDAILRKPGKLDDAEWEVIRQHPLIGYRILHRIKFLEAAAQIVLHHHEAYAGNGYPDKLKGEDIPLASRIFNVADTVDAMTSDRPYRKALSFDVVSAELKRCAGTQFDPKVVEAFHSIELGWWESEKTRIDQELRENPDFF